MDGWHGWTDSQDGRMIWVGWERLFRFIFACKQQPSPSSSLKHEKEMSRRHDTCDGGISRGGIREGGIIRLLFLTITTMIPAYFAKERERKRKRKRQSVYIFFLN